MEMLLLLVWTVFILLVVFWFLCAAASQIEDNHDYKTKDYKTND